MARRLSSVYDLDDYDDYDDYEEYEDNEDYDDYENEEANHSLEFTMRFNTAMMEALDLKKPLDQFVYTPLQGNEIRIMVLMVEGWTRDEGENDVNCLLINVEPKLIPSYECLSYVWGPPDDNPPEVWCNKRTFPISTQLLSALKCLRSGSKGPRFLWIDQLCINQRDAVEKGKQVQRMAEIYQGAQRVLLFPGTHPDFFRAIEFHYDFCAQFVREYNENPEGSFTHHWLHDSADDLFYDHDVPHPDDEGWLALRLLLSSSVFRRTWIVQELVLAREVRIMIDDKEYPFDVDGSLGFMTSLGMLNRRSLSPVQGQYLGTSADQVRALLLLRLEYRYFLNSSSRSLLSLLCDIRDFGVTDARDKVYGILSIASDVKRLGILPDYTNNPNLCYIDTARKVIDRTQSLDIMLCKETLRQMDDLPTWVPDWTCSTLEKFGNWIGKEEKLYHATKGLSLRLRDLKDDKKLGIQGIYIDTITSITTGLVDDKLTGMIEDLYGHGLWWMRAYSFIGPHYSHTNETLAKALGRTRLAGGHEENDKGSMEQYGLMDSKWYEVREDELRQGGYPTERETRNQIQMTGAVGTMTCYRVLFTTLDKFIGLAPLTARIGDMIFLLPGADTPFVLRRVRFEEYEVVGQCYTHGIMQGERVDTQLLREITLL